MMNVVAIKMILAMGSEYEIDMHDHGRRKVLIQLWKKNLYQ